MVMGDSAPALVCLLRLSATGVLVPSMKREGGPIACFVSIVIGPPNIVSSKMPMRGLPAPESPTRCSDVIVILIILSDSAFRLIDAKPSATHPTHRPPHKLAIFRKLAMCAWLMCVTLSPPIDERT
ncbi:hypothetical protein E4U25_002557 [Claviceps purpurea]|nr:hypothetical protein E4U25_002557 [Claviceps purpurea]